MLSETSPHITAVAKCSSQRGDAAAKICLPSASVRAGCTGAGRKVLGFPLNIAFPVVFASCRD